MTKNYLTQAGTMGTFAWCACCPAGGPGCCGSDALHRPGLRAAGLAL